MQLPYRKPGKYTNVPHDPRMTGHKLLALQQELERVKQQRPHAASEVARLAELGDFSENVEYQQAKGRLRGINHRITVLEYQINHAEIIEPSATGVVEIGSTVTVRRDGREKTYTILGSAETDPAKHVISYTSPLGEALLGHGVGDEIFLPNAPDQPIIIIVIS